MLYKDFKDLKLSALGLGCMRLPVVNGDDGIIDFMATEDMVTYAIQNGINYFDTAWGYHNGKSEMVVGESLGRYPRESYYLASKFPGYDLGNMDKVEDIFETQLAKCRVEYFDFYMFHNVCEMNIEQYLDPKYGIYDYLIKQRDAGRIRHLGFSSHGDLATMQRFIDAYGNDMEFCQIQLNYLDWTLQDAKEKVELLNKYNIPVWVMEPVRGGKLAKLSDKHEEALKALRPDETIPAWAFRFIQSIPGIAVTLSGMSNMDQLRENIETFSEEKPLNDEEMAAVLCIADEMLSKKVLPCTSCRYCTTYCPQGLDIPMLLDLYNEHNFSDGGFIAPMRLKSVPEDKHPSACIGCRACEGVCPQQIKISEAMADFSDMLK